MKAVVVSDIHLDHVTHGVPRFRELRAAVHRTVDVAIEEQAGLYIFAGDLCDPDSGSSVFRCVEVAIEAAWRLSQRGIPSIWVAGNHDVIEDGTNDTTLAPLRAMNPDMIYVFEEPGVAKFGDPDKKGREVFIIALPFTATSNPYDVESFLVAAAETVSAPRADVVIVSHLSVPGIEPGEETKEMPRGREVLLPVEAATKYAGLVLQGHYHRQQRTKEGIWVVGSMARLTFCEEKNDPGYLVVRI